MKLGWAEGERKEEKGLAQVLPPTQAGSRWIPTPATPILTICTEKADV